MSKHTPTPWEQHKAMTDRIIQSSDGRIIAHYELVDALRKLLIKAEEQAEKIDGEWGTGRSIDDIYDNDDMDQRIVNARALIQELDTKGE